MLRAIFFLDCDFCHQAHSKIDMVAPASAYSFEDASFDARAPIEDAALGDGWSPYLQEDTGEYLLMCCDCRLGLAKEMMAVGKPDF